MEKRQCGHQLLFGVGGDKSVMKLEKNIRRCCRVDLIVFNRTPHFRVNVSRVRLVWA